MAGVFRPALRSLASARCHAPMPPTSISAGAASSQAAAEPIWPESHAGPSRLPQRVNRTVYAERCQLPSCVADTDRFEVEAKATNSSVIRPPASVTLQSQPIRRPANGKGKARLIDDDDDDQPSWLKAEDPQFQPMPIEHTAQPLLYLPSRRELVDAISKDHQGFRSAWVKAFKQSTFKDALWVLRTHPDSGDIFYQTPPGLKKLANLLFLRLLDSVGTAQDVQTALEYTRIFDQDVVYDAYALSVLLERALRDLKAAHLCQPLFEHIATLARRIEATHQLHSVTLPRLAIRQTSNPRFASKRRSINIQHNRRIRQVRDTRVIQDLFLRLAFLLPNVRDERSSRTAHSLLYLVASQCRVPRRLLEPPSTSDAHDWRAPRRIIRMLHSLSRKRRRRTPLSNPPELLARITRAFLGSSIFNTSPYSRAALDTTVFVPPALIPHLSGTFLPRRRGFPSHLTYGRETGWLSCDLARTCVGLLSSLPVSAGAGRDRISVFDLQPLLMAAVRDEHLRWAKKALQHIMRLGLGLPSQDDSSRLVSARASLPEQGFFRACATSAPKGQVDASDVESQIRQEARQAYQTFVMLQKLDRNARWRLATSVPTSKSRTSYVQALNNVIHQVISDNPILAPLITPSSSNRRLIPEQQQQQEPREGQIYHTAVHGIDVIAQSSQYHVHDILACFGIDHQGDELSDTLKRFQSEDHAFHISGLPKNISQSPQAYVAAMRGLGKRGASRASDALFRALVRRASSGEPKYRLLRLDGTLLAQTWLGIQFSAQRMHGQGKSDSAISHFVKERADRILALMGLDVEGSRMSVNDCTLMRQIRVEPSTSLLAALIHGMTKWDLNAFAGLDLFFKCRERWPDLPYDVRVLDSVLVTSQRLVLLPRALAQQPSVLVDKALEIFRTHLLVQHPNLSDLTATSWRPLQAGSTIRNGVAGKDHEVTEQTGQRIVNFDNRIFDNYIALQSAKLRRILVECKRPIPHSVLRLVDELVLSLDWMRELGIQPKPSTFRLVFLPLKHVYRCENWPWPRGVQPLVIRRPSGKERVIRDGMGPLSAWLDEWVEGKLPNMRDVAWEYTSWERVLLAERKGREVRKVSGKVRKQNERTSDASEV
ncbi:hypothetical protein CF327_g4941 [Tilletia walkeri]|nr:hypothetical protein CF327_g4941 [Tilletia walkeri]